MMGAMMEGGNDDNMIMITEKIMYESSVISMRQMDLGRTKD